MPKFDKDPGPILDPGGGGGKPEISKPDLFHKNEGDFFEEIRWVADEFNLDDLNVVELLLPAVQQTDSLIFVKVEGTAESEQLATEAIISEFTDFIAEFEGASAQLLLPAVQAARETPVDKLMLKVVWDEGEGTETPENSAWDPLDGLG